MDDDVPVLIAGGSLVGLSTALFLGSHGVPVARRRAPSRARRSTRARRSSTSGRSSSTAASAWRTRSSRRPSASSSRTARSCRSSRSAGKELEYYFRHINDGVEGLSPSPRLFITQIGLEPILSRASRGARRAARVLHGARRFEPDDDGVTAAREARDNGAERTVRARYLVAADGSRSPVRERLGIALRRARELLEQHHDLLPRRHPPLIGDRNLSVIYVFGPALQGFFRFSKAGDAGFLVVNKAVDESGELIGEPLGRHERRALRRARARGARRPATRGRDRERAALERLRGMGRALPGRPRLPRRRRGAQHAADGRLRRQHRRAGRAQPRLEARARPRRHAPAPALLDTYDAERRPVGEFTVEQAYTRYVLRLAPELGKENLQPIVPEYAVELGYRYRSRAIVAGGRRRRRGRREPARAVGPPGHAGAARPADPRRAGRSRRSTSSAAASSSWPDADGEAWCDAARDAAVRARRLARRVPRRRRRGPRATRAVGSPRSTESARRAPTLLRPDGFVAWRADAVSDDAAAILRRRRSPASSPAHDREVRHRRARPRSLVGRLDVGARLAAPRRAGHRRDRGRPAELRRRRRNGGSRRRRGHGPKRSTASTAMSSCAVTRTEAW